jgi:hypothetical protein
MSNLTIDCLDCDTLLYDGTNYICEQFNNTRLCIQFEWTKFNKYGIPKKDKYHATEDSRRLFEVPIPKNSKTYTKLKELDDKVKSLFSDKESVNILKELENYPPLIRLEIKKDTRCWKEYKKVIEIKWETSSELKEQIKFNNDIRFVVKLKTWEYLGKFGVSLLLRLFETKESLDEDDEEIGLD